jgi:hypothetical protein
MEYNTTQPSKFFDVPMSTWTKRYSLQAMPPNKEMGSSTIIAIVQSVKIRPAVFAIESKSLKLQTMALTR